MLIQDFVRLVDLSVHIKDVKISCSRVVVRNFDYLINPLSFVWWVMKPWVLSSKEKKIMQNLFFVRVTDLDNLTLFLKRNAVLVWCILQHITDTMLVFLIFHCRYVLIHISSLMLDCPFNATNLHNRDFCFVISASMKSCLSNSNYVFIWSRVKYFQWIFKKCTYVFT